MPIINRPLDPSEQAKILDNLNDSFRKMGATLEQTEEQLKGIPGFLQSVQIPIDEEDQEKDLAKRRGNDWGSW